MEKVVTILVLIFMVLLCTPVSSYEIGIAWINDYGGGDGDLEYCDDNANDFKNQLSNWYDSVDYNESNGDVLESHFTDNGYSLDKPDISFHCGHGASNTEVGALVLNPDSGDAVVAWDEAYFGDYDLEWFGAYSCELLKNDSDAYWIHATSGGLHLLCGFKTTAASDNPYMTMGYAWGMYLDDGETVTDSWFKACDVTQPPTKVVEVISWNGTCFDDKLWGKGGPACNDPESGSYFYYLEHTCS